MKFNFKTNSTYSSEEIYSLASQGKAYVSHLNEVANQNDYEHNESSINLAFDDDLLEKVEQLVVKKNTTKLKYILVVGIGGSNLGTKAVYDAFYQDRDVLTEDRPKMFFVDTVNDNKLKFYTKSLLANLNNPEEYLLITISKSGGTTETLANTEILMEALENKFSAEAVKARTVVITDEDSSFWQVANETGVDCLAIPELVGGRYSVLSAVGLFPLLAIGFDVRSWRAGAKDMRTKCLSDKVEDNPALLSATTMAKGLARGKTINDMFIFNSELESLGKWYRQLLGESIGKENDLDGKQVNIGITPSVSIGSTDLHSVGQLYLGGPKDKLTTFVYYLNKNDALSVPSKRFFQAVVQTINNKTTTDIMEAILGGVKIAYEKNQLPFTEIEIAELSPYEIGAFMQFKMMEIMYLGYLLNVNSFNQPNVEYYKTETKELLK